MAGCSADGAAKVFQVSTKNEIGDIEGHSDCEVSKVQFRLVGFDKLFISFFMHFKPISFWNSKVVWFQL